jgi:catechol 2,3-dioxygenase-like lactoylglutathione lyase family enzyme
MGPILGLDHVQVAGPPGCEDDARRFYGVLLGLEQIAKPAGVADSGGVWFRCGNQELHVGVDPAFRPPRKAHLCFLVLGERYEELRETLRSRGVDVLEDGRIEGARRFFTRDPWGNRLEFRVA